MKTFASVDAFINSYPSSTQKLLRTIRQTIQAVVPEATEKIAYGIPTFVFHGNLIHYSAYEHHIGLYPGADPVDQFKNELKPYKTSKGTIQFPIDQPLPLDLITRITKACIARNLKMTKK